ncbi:hypothetical protein [Patulibacter americanus]|uniref:hypothetical protein n=1 Tax=Patulibacter americanus TaxID=588672 RepID=UPI0003B470DA|nr:hypothetical protein [Patulibacter americanus]
MLFTTADDVHDTLGRLMQELATDQEVGLRLSRLDSVVQLRYRNPDTTVTLVAREGDAPAVHLGDVPEGTPNPEVILTLDADTGHELWLGRQNLTIAIARGAIQAKGDNRRVLDLLGMNDVIAPHYEALLRATGREALIDPQPVPDGAPAEGEEPAGDAAEGEQPEATDAEATEAAGEAAVEALSGDDDAQQASGAEAQVAEDDAAAQ